MVNYFDNAIVLCDMVAVVDRCLIAVGCSLTAIGVDDVAAKSLLNFSAISGWKGGAGGHDMSWCKGVPRMTISILCKKIERNGIRTDNQRPSALYLI